MVPITRPCDVENLSDFSRYYQSSYVGWHSSDAAFVVPALIGGMLSETTVLVRLLSKQQGGNFQLQPSFQATWKDVLEHIDFGLPDIGMFPEGPTLSYCGYYTPRAAKKGFRPRDLSLTDFNKWSIRSKYSGNSDVNEKVWHAFNPEYKSLQEALKTINEGDSVGVPINKIMGVYTLPKFRVPIFAYKRWSVGHVEGVDTILLKTPFSDYATEIESQTGAKVVVG